LAGKGNGNARYPKEPILSSGHGKHDEKKIPPGRGKESEAVIRGKVTEHLILISLTLNITPRMQGFSGLLWISLFLTGFPGRK
jgi:hypothetical protein